jgi:hypothetical protein
MLGYSVRGEKPGPLFIFEDGRLLTRDRFVAALRSALEICSIDPSAYAGHSFRVGAATTAVMRRLQDSLIKKLGQFGIHRVHPHTEDNPRLGGQISSFVGLHSRLLVISCAHAG